MEWYLWLVIGLLTVILVTAFIADVIERGQRKSLSALNSLHARLDDLESRVSDLEDDR